MPNSSKDKGSRYERELVNEAKEEGFEAIRAYASDGRSLGHTSKTDLVISTKLKDWRVQAKRRKNISSIYLPDEDHVDCQMIREDYGKSFVVLPIETFFNLIKRD